MKRDENNYTGCVRCSSSEKKREKLQRFVSMPMNYLIQKSRKLQSVLEIWTFCLAHSAIVIFWDLIILDRKAKSLYYPNAFMRMSAAMCSVLVCTRKKMMRQDEMSKNLLINNSYIHSLYPFIKQEFSRVFIFEMGTKHYVSIGSQSHILHFAQAYKTVYFTIKSTYKNVSKQLVSLLCECPFAYQSIFYQPITSFHTTCAL